ncbi:MAG: dynamin family protein [Desulfobacteraceae bacterium]|nr:dynamin family protein [Desulfobacteraceae bacterium]
MYRENYINSLRMEMVEMVRDHLSPVALKYGYADVSLESTIKWRPLVLVVGNYSSGKSTLINEFLGADIQAIGQAPTDDSFTVITWDDNASDEGKIRVTEERDGKYLLNDPDYPFEILKKHGHRFASHFRLKKVNSPFLRNLALIDTPGMLDSITERDRGYDYQDVIGDMAQLADLVLVLFDPHKAGTVREAHTSLRETISARTFEDRVLFVLNRIDECSSLTDLLQVYGTLCWNLSQITGRKDIPMIYLTYSSRAAGNQEPQKLESDSRMFLYLLQNQRKKLEQGILDAPRRRLDNLATFIETHSERLDQLLEALVAHRSKLRRLRSKLGLTGAVLGLVCAGAGVFIGTTAGFLGSSADPLTISAGIAIFLVFLLFWFFGPMHFLVRLFCRKALKNIDKMIPLENQTRQDIWQVVSPVAYRYLQKTGGRYSLRPVRQEYENIHRIYTEGAREIRRALNELANIKPDQSLYDGLSSPISESYGHAGSEEEMPQNEPPLTDSSRKEV